MIKLITIGAAFILGVSNLAMAEEGGKRFEDLKYRHYSCNITESGNTLNTFNLFIEKLETSNDNESINIKNEFLNTNNLNLEYNSQYDSLILKNNSTGDQESANSVSTETLIELTNGTIKLNCSFVKEVTFDEKSSLLFKEVVGSALDGLRKSNTNGTRLEMLQQPTFDSNGLLILNENDLNKLIIQYPKLKKNLTDFNSKSGK